MNNGSIDRSLQPFGLQAGDTITIDSDGIHTLSQTEIRELVTADAKLDTIAEALLSAMK